MTNVAISEMSEMAALFIFVVLIYMPMEMMIGASLVVMTAVMAVIQFVKNRKYPSMAGGKEKICPLVLLAACVVLSADLCAFEPYPLRLMADIMFPLLSLCLITSSLWDYNKVRRLVRFSVAAEAAVALYYISCHSGLLHLPCDNLLASGILIVLVIIVAQFVLGLVRRIYSVKEVMKSGTIWKNVSVSVDAVYIIFILLSFSIYFTLSFVLASYQGLHSVVASFAVALTLLAFTVRIYSDSLFVIWRGQERRIVESMKVTNVESAVDASRIDDVYKDVYERVVCYFDEEKPFLDSNLTINDVVKSLYTNKLYISRSISQFTGRNFCQFVNYHRVMYSMNCFRENPDLKINELASMSGFNSIVSYNMAFRLFMGENPSEWSRKEKNRMFRSKK